MLLYNFCTWTLKKVHCKNRTSLRAVIGMKVLFALYYESPTINDILIHLNLPVLYAVSVKRDVVYVLAK